MSDSIVSKVVIETELKPTGFDKIAWEGINVDIPVKGDTSTQIPDGWTDVSVPAMVDTYPEEPPYPGEEYQSENEYTVAPLETPEPPPNIIVGEFPSGAGGGKAGSTLM